MPLALPVLTANVPLPAGPQSNVPVVAFLPLQGDGRRTPAPRPMVPARAAAPMASRVSFSQEGSFLSVVRRVYPLRQGSPRRSIRLQIRGQRN